MEALQEPKQELESTPLKIYRTAAVVKGGRRFSFAALVVVGDRHGTVGLGYAKAPGVPAAIEKAQKNARKNLIKVPLLHGTLPHPTNVTFCASQVKLIPAAPGTGVIAGTTVRAVLELAGVRDCLTKAYGSTNAKNLAKAVVTALQGLRSKADIERMRGVELESTTVEEIIEAGSRYAPAVTAKPPEPKTEEKSSEKSEKGGKGGKGRGGKGREGGGREQGGGQGGGGVKTTIRAPEPKAKKEQAKPESAEAPAEGGESPSTEQAAPEQSSGEPNASGQQGQGESNGSES